MSTQLPAWRRAVHIVCWQDCAPSTISSVPSTIPSVGSVARRLRLTSSLLLNDSFRCIFIYFASALTRHSALLDLCWRAPQSVTVEQDLLIAVVLLDYVNANANLNSGFTFESDTCSTLDGFGILYCTM